MLMNIWGIVFLISFHMFAFLFKVELFESLFFSFGLSTTVIGLIFAYAILRDWIYTKKQKRRKKK